jgi:hypothetical protein
MLGSIVPFLLNHSLKSKQTQPLKAIYQGMALFCTLSITSVGTKFWTLGEHHLDAYLFVTLCFLQILFFALWAEKEASEFTKKIYRGITGIALIVLGFYGSFGMNIEIGILYSEDLQLFSKARDIFICLSWCAFIASQSLIHRTFSIILNLSERSTLFWSRLRVGLLLITLINFFYVEYGYFYGLTPVYLYFAWRCPPSLIGSAVTQVAQTVFMIIFIICNITAHDLPMPMIHQGIYTLLGLLCLGVHLRPSYYPKSWTHGYDLWVYGVGIYSVILSWIVLPKISHFLPGILFLTLFFIVYEQRKPLVKFLNKKIPYLSWNPKAFEVLSFGFLWCFIGAHLVVHLQSHVSFFPYINFHTFLGLMALTLIIFLIHSQQQDVTQAGPLTQKIHKILSTSVYEAALILVLSLIAIDVPVYLQSVTFSLLSLGITFFVKTYPVPDRLHLYKRLALLAACLHLAIVASDWNSPLQNWYAQTHVTGSISLILLSLNAVWQQKIKPSSSFFTHPILWTFVVGVLFFYWRFDALYLTLVYVIWSVLLVLMSLYFQQKILAHVAFSSLAVCVVRLIVFDLHASHLLLKASVFVTVGALMFITQILYKKYQKRLET